MLRRQPRGHHPGDIDGDDHLWMGAPDYSFARERRLTAAADFAALLQAPRARSIRAARTFLSVIAGWTPVNEASESGGCVRFGVIVGRRNVRRAVDRVLAKRIVREACRQQAHRFDDCAARLAICIDVVLRVKSPLFATGGAPLAMRQWRRQLRSEADDLLQHLLAELPACISPNNCE